MRGLRAIYDYLTLRSQNVKPGTFPTARESLV
jgi:hypothetical protein